MTRSKAILIAIDQLFAAIITKSPDITISAWAWVWECKGKRSWPRKLIDGMFFWSKGHCEKSYEAEFEQRHIPDNFRLK